MSLSSTRSASRCPASSCADRPRSALAPWLVPWIMSVTGSRTKTASATASRICAEAIGGLERPRVLDGRSCACGEVDRERDVASLEHPPAFGRGEPDRAEYLPGDGHRGTHPGTELELAEEVDLLLVARRREEAFLVDDRDKAGLPGTGDAVRPDRGARVGGVLRAQLLDETRPLRVAMGQGEGHEVAIRVEQIDGAPIRHRGHDQVRDLAQGRGAVEGRPEDAAGIGEDRGQRDIVRVEDRRHRAADRRSGLILGTFGQRG